MPKKTNKTESIEAAMGQGKDEKRDRREIWKREPWVVSMKVTHVK